MQRWIDCSRLSYVPNENQKYAHSAVFLLVLSVLVVGNGWLVNLSSCHPLEMPSNPSGFIN